MVSASFPSPAPNSAMVKRLFVAQRAGFPHPLPHVENMLGDHLPKVRRKRVGKGAVVGGEADPPARIIAQGRMKQHQILIFQKTQEEFLNRGRGGGVHTEFMVDLPRVQQISPRENWMSAAPKWVSP